jgi:hypothetical protein
MTDPTTEERLQRLEQKYAALEHDIERLEAVNDIQRLLGRYEAIHNPTDINRSWEFFARHTAGTWMEISDWGFFEGFDLIKEVWSAMNHQEMTFGTIFEHDLATPIVQVAGDGQTAKGTWCSPGYETHRHPDGSLEPVWCWGKYAIDFVKENGEWRFWHFKWFRTFMIPFDKSWVEAGLRPSMRHELGKPSRFHRPYTPDTAALSIPPAPAAYETWTDEESDWQYRAAERI